MPEHEYATGGLIQGPETHCTVRPLGEDAHGHPIVSINDGPPEFLFTKAQIQAALGKRDS